MRRLPNKYERCILYQGAKDEAFASAYSGEVEQ